MYLPQKLSSHQYLLSHPGVGNTTTSIHAASADIGGCLTFSELMVPLLVW